MFVEKLVNRIRKGTIERQIRDSELEKLESVIAENYDALDESTVTEWDNKKILRTTPGNFFSMTVQFESFLADVKEHYESFRNSARSAAPKADGKC